MDIKCVIYDMLLARTYLKIIDHKFTVQRECGNGPLQARLSGDVIILRGRILDRLGAVKIDMAILQLPCCPSKQARGAFRKYITKPSEQVAAPPSMYPNGRLRYTDHQSLHRPTRPKNARFRFKTSKYFLSSYSERRENICTYVLQD